MTVIKSAIAAVALVFVTGGPSSASMPGPVELSGRTYHRAVCGRAGLRPGFAHCHAHLVTDARGNVRLGKSLTAGPNIVPAGYSPADLRSAYKLNGTGVSTTTVAIVDAYGYPNAEADLAVYRSQFGLPPCTTANGCFRKINQNGGVSYPAMDVGWAQETALDLDMVSAMCPNCHILLVQAWNNSLTALGTAVNQAAKQGAHAISNSYGAGETGTGPYASAWYHPGIAVTVSSGDNGYGVEFPASSNKVTAVGGTTLLPAANARGWDETVWSGAGSGCSSLYAKPVWQTDGLCGRRMVADVAAVADPNTGVAVYAPITSSTSAWTVFGGTSVAAPLIAGIYGVNGGPVNFGQDPYNHRAYLWDVKTGNNGSCGGIYFCTARAGYDGPTGLGTPSGKTAF